MRLIDADELLDDLIFPTEQFKKAFTEMINDCPTIDAEPIKHGRWVIEPDATIMRCNICGWAFEYYGGLEEEWNNCPHCGAQMDGGENDNR